MTESSPFCVPFEQLNEQIIGCRACPRLVEWREKVAREKRASFQSEEYWGKPVPNFGDINADKLIVGLAPAAHGGNRTGRLFTGDRSGDWIFRALHKARVANQAESVHAGDGLQLTGVYMTPIVHCAPPDNKPLPSEKATCVAYLHQLLAMKEWKRFLCLGQIAWDELHRALKVRPTKFGHGTVHELDSGQKIFASYHPSQQNTFTGRLTEEMLDDAVRAFLG